MIKVRYAFSNALRLLKYQLSRGGRELTWRKIAMLGLLGIGIFSSFVILMELTPSRLLVKTTFVATLEAQNVSIRVGGRNAIISGISGRTISGRDLAADVDAGTTTDLTQQPEESGIGNGGSFSYSADSTEDHLEFDEIHVPAGRLTELISSGDGRFFSLEAPVNGNGDEPVGASIVWNGSGLAEKSAGSAAAALPRIGSRQWSASAPLIEVETAKIDELVYAPISVVGLSLDRLRVNGRDQINTSSLLSGEIQFDVMGHRSQPTALRPGEFLRFSGLSAQLTNLVLGENGLRFVLVGETDTVETGFLDNLRDVQPSMLDAVRSMQSLSIIASSLFALLLAGLSAVNLGKKDETPRS